MDIHVYMDARRKPSAGQWVVRIREGRTESVVTHLGCRTKEEAEKVAANRRDQEEDTR